MTITHPDGVSTLKIVLKDPAQNPSNTQGAEGRSRGFPEVVLGLDDTQA